MEQSMRNLTLVTKNETYTDLTMKPQTSDISTKYCTSCKSNRNVSSFINEKNKDVKTCDVCRQKTKSKSKTNPEDIEKTCNGCNATFINKKDERSFITCDECRKKSKINNRKNAEKRKNCIPKVKSYSLSSILQVKKVKYNNNNYLVCRTLYKEEPIYFVIDYHKREVLEDTFYYTRFGLDIYGVCKNFTRYSDNGYIARQVYIDENKNKKQPILIHNILLDNFVFCGKGASISGDHLNRCSRDNRMANLRNASQTAQNYNQRKKARKKFGKLDFNADFIPKNLCYNSSKNTFTIEFKEINKVFYLQSMLDKNDKKLPNSVKLLLFQEILNRVHKKLPSRVRFLPEHYKKSKLLEDEFNKILKLSGFPEEEIKANLANNHQWIFATYIDSYNYERKSGTFYVLIPTEEQKEQFNNLIEKYNLAIEIKVNNIIESFK